jgi:hypothetical protein
MPYIYGPSLDSKAKMTAMKEKSKAWQRLEAQHRRLAQELGRIGFISQGSVFARPQGTSGSRYQWSWKDPRQKTRSLTLSREQFAWLQAAIGRERQVEKILQKMRRVSHRILLKHTPEPSRRKPLSIKTLGLI